MFNKRTHLNGTSFKNSKKYSGAVHPAIEHDDGKPRRKQESVLTHQSAKPKDEVLFE